MGGRAVESKEALRLLRSYEVSVELLSTGDHLQEMRPFAEDPPISHGALINPPEPRASGGFFMRRESGLFRCEE